MDNLYPRMPEMKAALEGDPMATRSRIEALKIKVLNGSVLTDTYNHTLSGFYCMLLVNEPLETTLREPVYRKALEGDYMDTLQEMLTKSKSNEEGMVY